MPPKVRTDEWRRAVYPSEDRYGRTRGSGFCHRSERMFQMDMLRRTARGEMAEVYGGDLIQKDKFARTIGFSRMAKENTSSCPPT